MINIRQLLDEYELHKNLAISMVDTIPAEKFTKQPAGIHNHPAWILGHLRVAENNAYKILTGKSVCSEDDVELFTVGSMPIDDESIYPDKTTLVEQYLEMHQLLSTAIEDALPEVFERPMEVERLKSRFPTIGMFLLHVTTGHEGYHLGQLNTWRRVAGLTPKQ